VIHVENLQKVYQTGDIAVRALKGITLHIAEGEFVAIMGPSGSGKSTFMNIVGCLDQPSEGSFLLDSEEVAGMSDDELALVRNRKIGFIFQTFNLIPRRPAFRQVMLPMMYNPEASGTDMEARALAALERVGLADRAQHKPNELSGGQQQRVAIARALVNNPPIILGDEPTGNLDTRTSEEIMVILQELHNEGKTIVMVTHEESIAEHADRIIRFKDGHIVVDEPVKQPLDAKQVLAELPLEEDE